MNLRGHYLLLLLQLQLLALQCVTRVNALMGTLKPQSNGSLYSSIVIVKLAVDGWGVTFGTTRMGLGGCGPAQAHRYTKYNSPPNNGQCTNFISLHVVQ